MSKDKETKKVAEKQEAKKPTVPTFTDPMEKLKYEFDNGSASIQEIINNILHKQISDDADFAKKFLDKKKDCKTMWSWIMDCAKKHLSSKSGYISPSVVYSNAIHYFDEKEPKYIKEMWNAPKREFGLSDTDFIINQYHFKDIEREVVKEVIKEVPKEVVKEVLSPERMTELKDEIIREWKKGKPKKEIIEDKVQQQLSLL